MPSRFRAVAALAALAACLEYSPHQLPTDEDERDLNRKALERILARPAGPLRFAVIGDTQRGFDEAKDAVALINARDDIQFVVQVGDFTNVGTWFEYREMNEIFRRLDVPYLVVVGNHDLLSNGAAIYREMFGPTNFTFTLERVHFVVFDSASVAHDFDGTAPDVRWVAEHLAPSPHHDRALALSHIAPGGGELFDDRLTLPLLKALGDGHVDLSISAHAHRFEYFEREGVRILVADSIEHRSYLVISQRPDGGFDYEKVDF